MALRLSLRLPGVLPMPAPPHSRDHHPPVGARTAGAAARVESLGHATKLRAPGDVLVEALLGLLGDSDPLSAGLLPEARDAAGRGALLLFGRRPDLELRQRPEDHDLVVLERHLCSREPAVREPTGKPTFDRSELFFIHNYNITMQQIRCQLVVPACRGGGLQGRWGTAL